MADLADDSSAALGCVHHPVSSGNPSGIDARAHHEPAPPARKRVADSARERREPAVIADHQARARLPHRLVEYAKLLLVDRRGLLEEHVAPGCQRSRCESCVGVVSRCDDDRIDVGHGEDLVQRRRHAFGAELLRRMLRAQATTGHGPHQSCPGSLLEGREQHACREGSGSDDGHAELGSCARDRGAGLTGPSAMLTRTSAWYLSSTPRCGSGRSAGDERVRIEGVARTRSGA